MAQKSCHIEAGKWALLKVLKVLENAPFFSRHATSYIAPPLLSPDTKYFGTFWASQWITFEMLICIGRMLAMN